MLIPVKIPFIFLVTCVRIKLREIQYRLLFVGALSQTPKHNLLRDIALV